MSIKIEKYHIDIACKIVEICEAFDKNSCMPWIKYYEDDKISLKMHMPQDVSCDIKSVIYKKNWFSKEKIVHTENVFLVHGSHRDLDNNQWDSCEVFKHGEWIKYIDELHKKAKLKVEKEEILKFTPVYDSDIFNS